MYSLVKSTYGPKELMLVLRDFFKSLYPLSITHAHTHRWAVRDLYQREIFFCLHKHSVSVVSRVKRGTRVGLRPSCVCSEGRRSLWPMQATHVASSAPMVGVVVRGAFIFCGLLAVLLELFSKTKLQFWLTLESVRYRETIS